MKRNLANLNRCCSSYLFKKNTYTSSCVCACVYINKHWNALQTKTNENMIKKIFSIVICINSAKGTRLF